MTIKKGLSYKDRPPHEKTEASKQFERELDEERTADRIELDGVLFERVRTCEYLGFDDGVDEDMDGNWTRYAPPTHFLSCHEVRAYEAPSYCPICGLKVKEDDQD